MKPLEAKISEFLKSKGYVHTEEHTESYKCKPYSKDSLRYSKPKPDPDGESEYSHTIRENVVDALSETELRQVLALEQQKSIEDISNTFKEENKLLREQIENILQAVSVIRNIMLGFVILFILSFLLNACLSIN